MTLTLAKAEPLCLKSHPEYSERWVQHQIIANPAVLGLGDVALVAAEKAQPRAGRLDLLLHDEQLVRRYEVELMLGATDPSHIIRCIEYWDIERRRYPAYEHVAVLVAEDITTRFLNVLALLAGNIPIIAIQLNALRVGDSLVLQFNKLLDQTELRTDDVYEGGSSAGGVDVVDRSFWESKSNPSMLTFCDQLLGEFNAVSQSTLQLKYVKAYVAVATEGSFFNVAKLFPRKAHAILVAPVSDVKNWLNRLEEAGLEADPRKANLVRIHLKPTEFHNASSILREFIKESVSVSQSG